jgi:hypothetical protein
MKKYIQVDYQDGEFKEVFEMNDGQRLFDEMNTNAEVGQVITIKVIELTDEQFAECQRVGDELA